jgi:hypothetical protein
MKTMHPRQSNLEMTWQAHPQLHGASLSSIDFSFSALSFISVNSLFTNNLPFFQRAYAATE